MQINIEGILRRIKGEKGDKLSFMNNDDGSPATYDQARKFLLECQANGWKLLPCNAACEGFDHFGGGCPGHEIIETEPENT